MSTATFCAFMHVAALLKPCVFHVLPQLPEAAEVAGDDMDGLPGPNLLPLIKEIWSR